MTIYNGNAVSLFLFSLVKKDIFIHSFIHFKRLRRHHPFSTSANFSEKLTFLTS